MSLSRCGHTTKAFKMDGRPLILDGGLATELEANGFKLQVLTGNTNC